MNQTIGNYGAMGKAAPVAVPIVRLDTSGQIVTGWGTGGSRRAEDVAQGVALQVQTPAGGWTRAVAPSGQGSAIAAAAGFVANGTGGYKLSPAATGTQGSTLTDSLTSSFMGGGSTDINGGGDAYSVMRGPSSGLVNASGAQIVAEPTTSVWTYLIGALVVGGVGYAGYRWYKGGSAKKAASRVKRAMKRFR